MLTVYTTNSCAFCPMVKKFLTMKKVEYKEVDVTLDNEKRSELFKKTGLMSVPVTTDGDSFVVGWNPGQLAALLDRARVQAV